MARADRIALRVPDAYAASVRWRRRRAGRIDGIHPAFLVLGGTAGLVHQVLGANEVRGAEVARTARLSPSATSAALRVLAEHGLADAAAADGAAVMPALTRWPRRPGRLTCTASGPSAGSRNNGTAVSGENDLANSGSSRCPGSTVVIHAGGVPV